MLAKVSTPTSTTLYCFSPPVMIATCIIELSLAVWSAIRYRRTPVLTVVMALLVFLAIFQLAEYFVCGGWHLSSLVWSRIGYIAITTLPALGAHLVLQIAGERRKPIVWVTDAVAIGLIGFFALVPTSVNASLCAGNYVIFKLHGLNVVWYTLYYYGAILISLMLAAGYIEAAKQRETQLALRWFIGGVLLFLIPTATVNAVSEKTIAGIPSIMCGFAVLFALVLVWRVLPLVGKRR